MHKERHKPAKIYSVFTTLTYSASASKNIQLHRYSVVLLGDRGTCLLTTYTSRYMTVKWPAVEPEISQARVQRHIHYTAKSLVIIFLLKNERSQPTVVYIWQC